MEALLEVLPLSLLLLLMHIPNLCVLNAVKKKLGCPSIMNFSMMTVWRIVAHATCPCAWTAHTPPAITDHRAELQYHKFDATLVEFARFENISSTHKNIHQKKIKTKHHVYFFCIVCLHLNSFKYAMYVCNIRK